MGSSLHFSSLCHYSRFHQLIPRNFATAFPLDTPHWNKPTVYFPLDCPYSRFPALRCSASISIPPVEDATPPSSRIFIRGLSLSTSEGQLARSFSHFGEVIKVKIITSKSSKQSLGLAYIWFSSQQEALSAIEQMNGEFFYGRFITVMMAKPESPSTQVKAKPYIF